MEPDETRDQAEPAQEWETTVHAPGCADERLRPPDGDGWALDHIHSELDRAGNLICIWGRLRPGLHAVETGGEAQRVQLPMGVVQGLATVVLQEAADRVGRQIQVFPGAEDGDRLSEASAKGIGRARRVVETLMAQINAGDLPQGLDVLVEPDPEPPREMGPVA